MKKKFSEREKNKGIRVFNKKTKNDNVQGILRGYSHMPRLF